MLWFSKSCHPPFRWLFTMKMVLGAILPKGQYSLSSAHPYVMKKRFQNLVNLFKGSLVFRSKSKWLNCLVFRLRFSLFNHLRTRILLIGWTMYYSSFRYRFIYFSIVAPNNFLSFVCLTLLWVNSKQSFIASLENMIWGKHSSIPPVEVKSSKRILILYSFAKCKNNFHNSFFFSAVIARI